MGYQIMFASNIFLIRKTSFARDSINRMHLHFSGNSFTFQAVS